MSTATTQGTQPIPGYALLERIGAGSYGEVWRAEAPGGLVKAVKIVYGFHNETRAVRELKALQHIKQLRHPFLLSIERFEIADGHLVIVTELADMSLKDRFQQCRAAGAPGIEREELLSHMRDAADALDYINDTQSLQHLDVKAENLLLVGGRLKVGDFGLVQNLSDSDSSLLEGMTPRYAAPEIFKGRPTKYSDQFSLAVVYTELLTGHAPFDAKSAADFAVQHMLGTAPKLDALSAQDRAAVARALAIKPEHRHPNCRAFVAALTSGAPAEKAGTPPPAAAAGVKSAARPIQRSATSQPPVCEERTIILSPGVVQPVARCDEGAPARRLPAFEVNELTWQARPTLVIGVGGVAVQALSRLRRRLEDRFLFPERIPAWRMELFDTDATSLRGACATQQQPGGFAEESTLHLPLRTTQEYRERSPQLLRWLSRRWLYNISRDPCTSGWRPLGRLALTDHGPEVMERLRTALGQIATPEALAESSATVGT
jgi:serine/threonine protein kinase